MSRPWASFLVAALAGALLAWPFVVAARSEIPTMFNALAADSYYYAALSRNFLLYGFFGIDGQTASNGFMPLWQIIVTALDFGLAGPGTAPVTLLSAMLAMSLVLMIFGVALFVWFVSQCFGARFALITLPLICPGAAFFAFEHAYHQFNPIGLHSGQSMWSFANGMESALGLALFALFVPIAVRALDPATATHRNAFVAGGLAFLIMMARLDDVFVGIAFGLCLLPVAWRHKDTRLVLRFAMLPLLGTAAFLGLNTLTAGHPLPTSGMLKTQLFGFPNGWAEFTAIGTIQAVDTRLMPLLVAVLVGTMGVLSQLKQAHQGWDTPLIRMLSIYLILKAGFLLSSVPLYEQGYWYFTNLIAAINLLCVLALARFGSNTISIRTTALVAPVLLLITGAAAQNASAQLKRYPEGNYTTVNRDICTDPAPFQNVIPDGSRIIDTGDGVYGFCLGHSAVTLTGLADSGSFNNLRNEQGFFPAALSQGHDILVDSPIPWASYDWRGQLDGHDATLLTKDRNIRVWKISPAQ